MEQLKALPDGHSGVARNYPALLTLVPTVWTAQALIPSLLSVAWSHAINAGAVGRARCSRVYSTRRTHRP